VKSKAPPRIVSAIVVVLHPVTGKILSVWNRAVGGWCLPGGKLGPGEESVGAAIRELKEETNLDAPHLSYLCSGPSSVTDNCTVHVYHCGVAHGVPAVVEAETRVAWKTWAELLNETKFLRFYNAHFPDGIEHLAPTAMPDLHRCNCRYCNIPADFVEH